MDILLLFTFTGAIIFVGFFGEWFFEKTKIPDALWLLALGALIGYFRNTSGNQLLQEVGPIFITFALIFILFEGVLNLDLRKLLSGMAQGGNISVLSFVFSMFLTAFIMMLFGWGFWEGILLGAILSDSAQAVILPLVKKIKLKQKTYLILTFESVISDIFVIVGALAIINIIALKSFSAPHILESIIYSFVLAAVVGVAAGFLWARFLAFMEKFLKSYLTTIAAMLLLYSFVEYMKASGPLACLAFGVVIGNSKKIAHLLKKETSYTLSNSARFFFSEISFFLKTFFFVYLGLIINLRDTRLILIGIMLGLLLFIARPLSVYLTTRKSGLNDKETTFLQVLNPKGLSAAVMAQIPLQYGISHGQEFSTIVMSAIVTSILLSIAGVFLTERTNFRGVWKLAASGVRILRQKVAEARQNSGNQQG